jgi:hypothetical protein
MTCKECKNWDKIKKNCDILLDEIELHYLTKDSSHKAINLVIKTKEDFGCNKFEKDGGT